MEANNIDKNRPVVMPTADDPRSNSTVGAGGDSSAFVVATPVEEIEEVPFWSAMVGVVVSAQLLVTVVLILVEVVFVISATWKLVLMVRS